MKIFKNNGKDCVINITFGTIERIKFLANFDMTKLFDDDLKELSRLFNDPLLLIRVLWCSVTEWADSETARLAFCDSIRGDALEAAAKALVEDFIDFFPNQRQQQIWREMVANLWQIVDKVQDQQAKAMQSVADALKSNDLESLMTSSSPNAGSSVESSESTLAATS